MATAWNIRCSGFSVIRAWPSSAAGHRKFSATSSRGDWDFDRTLGLSERHLMSHPLEDVRILELGQIIAGTYGSQVLSDLGAEVIKIEAPEGDLGRIPSVAPYRGLSGLFLTFNRNKQSVVINLKSAEGRQLFYDLVKISDVVIDNFRPGVLERLQIDYPTLNKINPRIIHCSVTGFGGAGAYKDLPALDLNIQAISGHMAITDRKSTPMKTRQANI